MRLGSLFSVHTVTHIDDRLATGIGFILSSLHAHRRNNSYLLPNVSSGNSLRTGHGAVMFRFVSHSAARLRLRSTNRRRILRLARIQKAFQAISTALPTCGLKDCLSASVASLELITICELSQFRCTVTSTDAACDVLSHACTRIPLDESDLFRPSTQVLCLSIRYSSIRLANLCYHLPDTTLHTGTARGPGRRI